MFYVFLQLADKGIRTDKFNFFPVSGYDVKSYRLLVKITFKTHDMSFAVKAPCRFESRVVSDVQCNGIPIAVYVCKTGIASSWDIFCLV